MATKTDVNDLGSDDADAELPADPKPEASLEEYKRRFDGANRAITSLTKSKAALQKQIDELTERYEGEITVLRQGKTTVDKATADLRTQLEAAVQAKTEFEKKVQQYEVRSSEAKVIQEKFPALTELHLSGDLRSRVEFSGDKADADYEAYLTRMAAKIAPAPAQAAANQDQPSNALEEMVRRYSGITPVVPNPISPAGRGGGRTVDQIRAEMDTLDPRIPQNTQKYEALIKELDAAIG